MRKARTSQRQRYSPDVVKGSEIEGTVDEGVGVEDVEPEAEWFECISGAVRWVRVIRSNEMECGAKV